MFSSSENTDLSVRKISSFFYELNQLYHFWQTDRDDPLPLGPPQLMGSLTSTQQLNVDEAMKMRNEELGIDMAEKRRLRADIEGPGVHENADWWWREAEREGRGIYERA